MSGSCCTHTIYYYIFYIVLALWIYAKFLRVHIAGYLLKNFGKTLYPFLKPCKAKLFADAFGLVKCKSQQSLDVLEIGVGTGANFTFYPENCKITVLDKTNGFLPHLKKTISDLDRHDLRIDELVVNDAEHMKDIKSNSMDVIVSTFILCSVEDPVQVLNEINRVLKPGGVFLFLEHSKDTTNSTMAHIHTYLGPLWTFFFGDCRFREMDRLLKNHSNLENLELSRYKRYDGGGILSIINPLYYGYGQKKH
jgi:SAM-dependent methyltransferase